MRLLLCIVVSVIVSHLFADSAFQTEGRVSPLRILDVLPAMDGIITKINFKEGAHVSKGDVLFELDSRQQHSQLESYKAEMRSAQIELERTSCLYNRMQSSDVRGVTRMELDEAKSAFDLAKCNLDRTVALIEMAEDELSKRRIIAPFNGKIGFCAVSEGSFVATYREPMARLVQMDPIRVIFDLPISKRHIMHSAKLQLRFADMTAYNHVGVVDFENNETLECGDSFLAGAAFPNPENELLPGMKVFLEITSVPSTNCR